MKKVLTKVCIIMLLAAGYMAAQSAQAATPSTTGNSVQKTYKAKSYYNKDTIQAIGMYKKGNFTECLQILYDVVDKDPSNVLAYYYIAISHARLGDANKAKTAYERVIEINSSTQLSNLSQNGIECLADSSKCMSAATLDPTQQAMEAVNKQLEDKKIDTIKSIVNKNNNAKEVPADYLEGLKDYSLPKNQEQNKSEVPTNDEILAALDTLKRAGYQNYMPQPAMTPEMMQLSMMNSLSGNGYQNYNNSMVNFLPYMMNSQNDMSQIDPQVMQTMMMSSMMGGLSDFGQ